MSEQVTPTKAKRTPHNYTYQGRTFTSIKELLTFLQVNKQLTITDRIIQCRYCGTTFSTQLALNNHYFGSHSDKIKLV